MLNNFVGKDIINIGDMTPDQFQYLLDLSKMLKAEKMTGVDHARFHNKNVVAPLRVGVDPHPLRLRDLLP